jgi:hypothetical protein
MCRNKKRGKKKKRFLYRGGIIAFGKNYRWDATCTIARIIAIKDLIFN